jgi:hypothetical protein
MQRNDTNRKEIEGMMAIVAKGDALDKAAVQKIFDSAPPRLALVPAAGGRLGLMSCFAGRLRGGSAPAAACQSCSRLLAGSATAPLTRRVEAARCAPPAGAPGTRS